MIEYKEGKAIKCGALTQSELMYEFLNALGIRVYSPQAVTQATEIFNAMVKNAVKEGNKRQ
jgi:hypothetical protein